MKYIVVSLTSFFLAACSQQRSNAPQLQAQIDSLRHKVENTYTPGLGEFMGSIQVHHNKLWFAGTNNNWKLADFEVHEIQEALQNIQNFNSDRPEAKSIRMLDPAVDSVNKAIKEQNPQHFKDSFVLLTNTCNHCHRATAHEFNVVTIPTIPPYSNQSFKPVQ